MNKVEIAKELAKCFNESKESKRFNESAETSIISKSKISMWIDKFLADIIDGAADGIEVKSFDFLNIGTINGKTVVLGAQNLLSKDDFYADGGDDDEDEYYSLEDILDTIGYPIWFSLYYSDSDGNFKNRKEFADLEPDDFSADSGENADKIIAMFNKEAKTGGFNESSKKHVLYAQPADDNSGSRFAEHEFSTKDDLKKIFKYYYRDYLIAWYGLRYEGTLDKIIDNLMEKEDGEYLYTWIGDEGDAADFGALAEDFEVGKYFGLTEEHYEDGECIAGNMFTKLYIGVDDFANGFD